ncbi:GTPase family protein [Halobaculum sp. MBLA0147]|uniref:GTPase family protein n=1 Tax=Halobaculum sp. MBLA0147 TaxID=3079934 RepID=UPI00352322E8
MPEIGLGERMDELLNNLPVSEQKKRELRSDIQADLEEPVRLIGAGQTGVGKSTLLRSIFAVRDEDIPEEITTDATRAETERFRSFQIENEDGFKIEFTDGPGLGESMQKDEELIPEWIEQVRQHDLLYWVIDASSRDIRHIQENMKRILDETGYRDRIVVVLNKVDQIELERSEREDDIQGWNETYNVPTDELERQIERRTDDIVDKLTRVGVPEDQIVACSALKRWNHGKVLDTIIQNLPPEKQIKASANRDVADIRELVSDEVLEEIE